MKTILIFCLTTIATIANATTPFPVYAYTVQDVVCVDGVCRPVANVASAVSHALRPERLQAYSFRSIPLSYGSAGTVPFAATPATAVALGSAGMTSGGAVVAQSFFTYSDSRPVSQFGVTHSQPGLVLSDGGVLTKGAWRASRRQVRAQRPGIFNWRWRVANRTNR